MSNLKTVLSVFTLSLALIALSCGQPNTQVENVLVPGQTEFSNSELDNGHWSQRGGGMEPGFADAEASNDGKAAPPPAPGEPPQGRTGEVEEADIYKVDDNRLFYLNTYRGFMIYDVNDPKDPKLVSRLPVFGYPIEMFIQGNTVYALIRDALYLTQVGGKLQFERNNVSQLVAIDITDLANPKVLQTVDIIGELREGVSRKIEDTIYVVSYRSKYYYHHWNYGNNSEQTEQAWVYSFNVADPQNLQLVEQLQVFEGGGYDYHDEHYNTSVHKYFNGVSISATSNALMVVENWQTYGWVSGSKWNCGSSTSQQQAVVSIIDISDPQGKINLFSKFETYGQLSDQFKQTYIYDEATGKGTYLGIFGRREWSSINCDGSSFTQNTLESWDITDGSNPVKVSELAFGKPNETVRGSVFDADRRVAFAITAERIDPLYALSFEDPTDLKVLSEVDGLSGDMNVFRFIGDKQFLIGIGRDNSDTCTGFVNPSDGRSTNMAVSIIDVQDLSKIRLVQRKCVAVKDASWINSEINNNLDQAHKMIGMHSDGTVNAITIPVYYYKKSDEGGWWWYGYETAVGLMTWDLAQYDPSKSELGQTVLTNYGTIIHPKGQVRRSIIFTHKGAQDRRMVINLSNTHFSVVDIQDLNNPVNQSIVEIAPYHSQLFRFGDHLVEHILPAQYSYYEYGGANTNASEFRIKAIGGKLEDAATVASFTVGQVERVIKYKENLVLFRRVFEDENPDHWYGNWKSEILVYDLSDPANPVQRGSVELPYSVMPYYYYWCGMDAYWGRYWFNNYGYNSNNWAITDHGLTFLANIYDDATNAYQRKLLFVDLTNTVAPALSEYTLASADSWQFFGLIPDPMDTGAFFLTYRTKIGEIVIDDTTFTQYKYYAQRWTKGLTSWTGESAINLPGRLMKTWSLGGERVFLTHDTTYKKVQLPDQSSDSWKTSFRVNLLKQIAPWGVPLAELKDFHNFDSFYLEDMVVDGSKLFINARHDYYYNQSNEIPWDEVSDYLMIFNLENLQLDQAYSAPTGTYRVQLMGTHQGNLFVNLPGDGILVVDVSDPAQPFGQQFMRTLGYTTHIEFADNTAYLAAGYFGVYQLDLAGAPVIPTL